MSDKKKSYKTLLELEAGDCRWPVGDPRQDGFHFCGAPQMVGRPYCVAHWPLSFVPGKGRNGGGASNASVNGPVSTQVRRAA